MGIVTTGSNTTGSRGVIAIDKVANAIRFLDPETLRETSSISGPRPCVHELAISPDHTWAAVPLYGDGIYGSNRNPGHEVLIVDLATRAIAQLIDTGHPAPHGMVAVSETELWVVCDIPRKLLCIDVARGCVTAAYDCPAKGPHILVANADGSRLYVSSKEGDVQVFDTAARAFVGSLRVGASGVEAGNGSGSEGITPTPDGRYIVAIDNERGELRVFDAATSAEVQRVPLVMQALTNPKRSRLAKLMYSPDGRHLVVTSYASGNCWVIDGADLTRQTLVPLAKGPMGIAFAPEGGSALVSSHDSGLLTRIDLATGRAVEAFDGGAGIEVLCYF
jgi:DNA-binding beta-propeller fold protein YncE